MIIGGHSLLGIEAQGFDLQKEIDRISDEVTPDKDMRLLVIHMDGPGEGGLGSDEPGLGHDWAEQA